MNSRAKLHKKILVRNGQAQCPSCGTTVRFLTEVCEFSSHRVPDGRRWCNPRYHRLAFVLPDGTELRHPDFERPRVRVPEPGEVRLISSGGSGKTAAASAGKKKANSDARRKPTRPRKPRGEDPDWLHRRRMERGDFDDPFRETGIQDFDVPPSGRSVRARRGGAADANSRRR